MQMMTIDIGREEERRELYGLLYFASEREGEENNTFFAWQPATKLDPLPQLQLKYHLANFRGLLG